MTIIEVIDRLRYKAENIKAKLEPEYFSECADYLERYRWHDLRVDPSDLPPEYEEVLVTGSAIYKGKPDCGIGWAEQGGGFMSAYGHFSDALAWRRVVPFEGWQDEEQRTSDAEAKNR